jgi:HEAT repeat protein
VLGDSDYHVQRMAIKAIGQIRPEPKQVVEALAEQLDDADPSVGVAALHVLTEYGEAGVSELAEALTAEKTRYWAALALGELGPKAKAAVKALGDALADKNPETRREVLIALARIGPDAAEAVPAITPLVQDPDPSVSDAAGFALGSIGPAAASAADALRKAMERKDRSPQSLEECVFCWALARIEPQNKHAREHAIEMLIGRAKEKNPRVQSAVIRGLMDLGAEPKQLVPALEYIIVNGQEPAVGEALGALASLGDAGIEVLDEALTRRESRARAAMVVAHLGAKAKAVVPQLALALADENAEVRRETLFALAAMGDSAAGATAAIQKSLDDPLPENRAVAAYALGRIGPAAKAALPRLQEELRSPEPLVRVASAYAVVHVDPRNEPLARAAMPVLVQGLQSPNAAARRGSAEGLAHIGKPARTVAEGALRAATSDPDESVRRAALEALEKIGAIVDAPLTRPVPQRRR